MCLYVFEIFASSVLTHYVLVFCVTLWQPAGFYSVLVLYLTTHSILKPTYVNACKHYSRTYCCLVIRFVPRHNLSVHLTMKCHTVQKELWYFGGVEELLSAFCVSTCLHYINSSCTPVALCWSSLHFRRHFILHFTFCC